MIDLSRVRGAPLPPSLVGAALSYLQFARRSTPQHSFWQPNQAASMQSSALSVQQQMQRAAHAITLDSITPTTNRVALSPSATTSASNPAGTGTTVTAKSKGTGAVPGTWTSSKAYNPGDIVLYGGNTYAAETANTNQTPSWSSPYWALIGPATTDQLKNGTSTSTLLTTMVNNGNIGGSYHAQVGIFGPTNWYPMWQNPNIYPSNQDYGSLGNNLTQYVTVSGGSIGNGAALIPGNSYKGAYSINDIWSMSETTGPTFGYYTAACWVGLNTAYPSVAEPIFGLSNTVAGTTPTGYEPSCWIGTNGHLYAAAFFSAQTVLDAGFVDWTKVHHVAVTCSNSTLTVFIDGIQAATVTPGGTHYSGTNVVWLFGMYASSWLSPVPSGTYISSHGELTIQEFAIWFGVLSNQTILQLYQAGAAGAQSADMIPSGSEQSLVSSQVINPASGTLVNAHTSATMQANPLNFYQLGTLVL